MLHMQQNRHRFMVPLCTVTATQLDHRCQTIHHQTIHNRTASFNKIKLTIYVQAPSVADQTVGKYL